MQPLLLDTCALIFMTEKVRLDAAAIAALQAADQAGATTYISPMSAWEIGMLSARGRLQLLIKPERWFANLLQVPGVELADPTPEVLIASSYLPGDPPNDPVDRIVVTRVAGPSRQVYIHVEAGAVTFADRLDAARLNGEASVLVDRDGKHARIADEDRLASVPVVSVDVDDRDALEVMHLARRGGCERAVVEDAEAVAGFPPGMVA